MRVPLVGEIRFRDEHGQVEAPFQLLIAAVMLGMLLPIAFYLFGQYQMWESQERVRNNMETLAREIEVVANLGEGIKYIDVDLNVYTGPNFRVDNFSIANPGQDVCLQGCHTPHCMQVRAYYVQEIGPTGKKTPRKMIPPDLPPVCIRIPFNVDVTTEGCSQIEGMKGQYVDLGVDLNPGFHRIVAIKKGYTVYLCKPKEKTH